MSRLASPRLASPRPGAAPRPADPRSDPGFLRGPGVGPRPDPGLSPGAVGGFVALALALALTSCAAAPVDEVALDPGSASVDGDDGDDAGDDGALELDVAVTELVDEDRWRVRFDLPAPAAGLRFLRNRNHFRAARWQLVEPPGATWAELEGFEVVLPPPGTTLAHVVLELDTEHENRKSDYNQNFDFTDGSRLFFTGHLNAEPLSCAEPACTSPLVPARPDDQPLAHDWRFETSPGRHIALLETLERDGDLDWRQSQVQRSRGTFVYFGPLEPLRTDALTLFIDPGMPTWMVERTRSELPALFAWYREATGVELAFAPLVLLSFGGTDSPGFSLKGGTLDQVVQLDASGAGWAEGPGTEAEARWFHFLSHEGFHLWNSQMFHVRGGRAHEWLSEGSAEYMSMRAAEKLGTLDATARDQRLVDSANRCLAELDGVALMSAPFHGRYSAFYACGPMLFAWMDAVARRDDDTDPTRTAPGHLLAELFRRTDPEHASYSSWDLVALLDERSGDPLVPAPLLHILQHGPDHRAEHLFQTLLAETGVATTRVEVETIPEQTVAPLRAISQLLDDCDCASQRKLGLHLEDTDGLPPTLRLEDTDGCATLATTDTLVRVAGQDLSDMRAVHGALRRALADGLPVELETRAESDPDAPRPQPLTLRCTDPDWRPAWRELLAPGTPPIPSESP